MRMRPGGISPHVARPVVRFRNNRARGQDFDAGAGMPAIVDCRHQRTCHMQLWRDGKSVELSVRESC